MSDVDNKFSQEMQTTAKPPIHSDKQAEIVQFLLADVMRNYYNASYGVKDNE